MTKPSLPRNLGLWTTISMVIGGVIGSGIFMKPALMASQLGSPVLLITVWVVAGIITMFGALTNAEVAAMMPETGGQYVFFKKMFGDFFAFLYGWAAFAVFNTAGVASIAYVMAQYFEYFYVLPQFSENTENSLIWHLPFIGNILPLENFGVKAFTIGIIILLTIANFISVRFGGAIQVFFTVLKVMAIFILIIGIMFSGKGSINNFLQRSNIIDPSGFQLLGAFMAAIAGAFWAYDGWNNITFIAGEIKDPQRNIPASLFTGILACILIYTLVNFSYLYVLPIDVMAGSSFIASDAAGIVVGTIGAGLISLLVMISTFGTTNGNILATARVSFAMACEGRFFSFAGKIHPIHNTPGNALWLHCIWTCLLVISGSFDTLTDMLIFVSWLFYGMSAIGVFVLRYKFPAADRPYKVWGYPLVPVIFIGFTMIFLGTTLFNDINNYLQGRSMIINSFFGMLLILPGVPLYWYFRKR